MVLVYVASFRKFAHFEARLGWWSPMLVKIVLNVEVQADVQTFRTGPNQ